MNVNNQMYRMFNVMMEGYNNNDMNAVEQGARCWMDLDPENPFQIDTPEHEAFFQIKRAHMLWKKGNVGSKLSRREMIMWAKKLCELEPKQPYRFNKKAEEEEKRLMKEAEEQRLAKLQEDLMKEEVKDSEIEITQTTVDKEPKYVFGVLPDKTPWYKKFFKKKEGVHNDSERSD